MKNIVDSEQEGYKELVDEKIKQLRAIEHDFPNHRVIVDGKRIPIDEAIDNLERSTPLGHAILDTLCLQE